MLSFFKKKPFLKDLIPDNCIDIHSHILPGIDDGAKTIADSLFLLNGLQQLGFTSFITTPHVMSGVWNNTKQGIEATLKTTLIDLKTANCSLPLRAAAEYLIDSDFTKLFKKEPLLTLKDDYVLIEMSYINPPINLYDIIFELQVAGYKPILAHPERYSFFHHTIDEYIKLKHCGCQFQMNLLSTTGYYGLATAKIAEKLLNKGMIDFVGSDAHHANHIKAFSNKVLLKDVTPLNVAFANNSFFKI